MFNTTPQAIHCPHCDQESDLIEMLLSKLRNAKLSGIIPDELAVISWDNKNQETPLKRSFDLLGIKCLFLGKGEEWLNNEKKISLTNDFLRSTSKKYVIGLDAYDAVLFGCPQKILNEFKKMKERLVFNATLGSYPPIDRLTSFEKSLFPEKIWCHLNAGAWIGETEYCKQFFGSLLSYKTETSDYAGSEQLLVRMALQKEYPNATIDHECKMFQIIREPECYPEHLKSNRGIEINGKSFKEIALIL